MPGYHLMANAKGNGDTVSLKSVSNSYPDPSPTLLQIHASLCQVLHASGAGEAIDRILREWKRYRVFAEDGRDAELLSARLSLIQAC